MQCCAAINIEILYFVGGVLSLFTVKFTLQIIHYFGNACFVCLQRNLDKTI